MALSANGTHKSDRMNLRKVLIPILIVFAVNLSYAQPSAKYLKAKQNPKFREGYVVDTDSTVIKGLVKGNITDDRKLHVFITFVSLEGKKKNYYPWHLKGYGFDKELYVSDDKSFHKLLISGSKVELYRGTTDYNLNIASSSAKDKTKATEVYYLKKPGDESFELVKKETFDEQLSKYFKKCRSLASYIDEKKLRFRDTGFAHRVGF